MEGVIEKRIVIHAKPETVYRALTESRYLAKWLADTAEAKPVPGGSLLLYSGAGESAKGVDAAYTEIIPNRSVRFRWIARILGGQKTAERGTHENAFLIVESPDGVIVTMRDHESPPPSDPERVKTEQGWDQVLVALKTLCEGPEAPGKAQAAVEWGDEVIIAPAKPKVASKAKKAAARKPKEAKKAKKAKKARKAKMRARPARRAKVRKAGARRVKARARGGKARARNGARKGARKARARKSAKKARPRKTARRAPKRKAARRARPKKKSARKAKKAGARRKK